MAGKPQPSSGSAFDIDTRSGIVLSRFFGTVTPAEVVSHMLAVGNDTRYRSGMCTLADLCEAKVNWTLQEIVEFRIMLFDTYQNRLTGRWALLTRAQGKPGVTKLLENMFLRVDAKLFQVREEALRWLRDRAHAEIAAPLWNTETGQPFGIV